AAAIAVLVRADAGASRGARRLEADRGCLSFQSWPDPPINPDWRSKPLGDRRARTRADRAVSAAALADRAADGGWPRAPFLALGAAAGRRRAGAGVVVIRRVLDHRAARTARFQ